MENHFDSNSEQKEKALDITQLNEEVDEFARFPKDLISADDKQLLSGVKKLKLASAFHQSWVDFRRINILCNYTNGKIHHGKRIAVQATAAGRR